LPAWSGFGKFDVGWMANAGSNGGGGEVLEVVQAAWRYGSMVPGGASGAGAQRQRQQYRIGRGVADRWRLVDRHRRLNPAGLPNVSELFAVNNAAAWSVLPSPATRTGLI
jgi:hypothetical protein